MANEITTQLNKVQPPQLSIIRAADTRAVETPVSKPADEESKQLLKSENKVVTESKESIAEKLKDKVSQLNDQMQNLNRTLQFTVDEESGDSVVTVRDAKTEEVIRQFPSDELLKARHAADNVKGMLIEVDA